MSVEIVIPFALDSNGAVLMTQDPDVQAAQHVKSLVVTEPGERVMQPDYGVPTREWVFAPGTPNPSTEIALRVTSQMAQWEPSINVLNVTPIQDEELGRADIQVDYQRNPSPGSATYTATVEVGGNVVDTGTL